MEARIDIDRFVATFVFRKPYPFSEKELAAAMTSRGFEKGPAEVGIEVPSMQTVRPQVFRGKGAEVRYRPEDGFVGVGGKDFDAVIENTLALENLLEKDFAKERAKDLRYLELNLTCRVSSKKPMETIPKVVSVRNTSKLSGIFGEDLAPLTLRVFPAKQMSTEDDIRSLSDWFDLRIEPLIVNPEYYFLELVYRSKEIGAVIEFLKSIEAKVREAIAFLEGGA